MVCLITSVRYVMNQNFILIPNSDSESVFKFKLERKLYVLS